MSRTTSAIYRINKKLNEISGLTGIVSDFMELKEKEIDAFVDYIKKNHFDANDFDNFYGKEPISYGENDFFSEV